MTDPSDTSDLFLLAYGELRAVAVSFLRRERRHHTLAATALVHEAWLRLQGVDGGHWRSRDHFLAVATRALRRVLVNHAEARAAKRRGGDEPSRERLELESVRGTLAGPGESSGGALDVLALHEALERLRVLDPQQARIVELRFFGGLTLVEVASVLGVSRRTVDKGWAFARAWLRRALDVEESAASTSTDHGPHDRGSS